MTKKTKKMVFKMNNLLSLTEEEKKCPILVIKQFCKTFKQAYVKIEILDLLDAVITYEGNKTLNKVNLVLFYQHVYCLIKLAYRMGKHKKSFNILNISLCFILN